MKLKSNTIFKISDPKTSYLDNSTFQIESISPLPASFTDISILKTEIEVALHYLKPVTPKNPYLDDPFILKFKSICLFEEATSILEP